MKLELKESSWENLFSNIRVPSFPRYVTGNFWAAIQHLEAQYVENKETENKLIEKLKILAKRECWTDSEDFNPYDFSGGNSDDAYYGGVADGETSLAKEVLKMLEGSKK